MANTNQRDSIFAIGTDRDDNLTGARGDDYIEGGEGNDIIIGKAGNDALYGDEGIDRIKGENGNDEIGGGSGDGHLTGGEGADKFFVWQNVSHRPFDFETNIITDFNSEEGDRLVFDTASGHETSLSALNLSIRGPFDDVTWVTNLVGNNIYASLEGVNFRDVTDWTFDQYFEVI